MIDLHTHLLPGVDDGSPSVDVSVPVLTRFAREGVELVVCTPHLQASRADQAPYGRHRHILRDLVAHAPPSPRLVLGWEIMLDRPGCDLTAPWLALGASAAVLVEFPGGRAPMGATAELARLRASGIVPVLAHPERYHRCTIADVREWRDEGVVIQSDATMLLATGLVGDLAKAMLEEGLVDCLASDNHGDGRSLATAAQWLREAGAEEHAALLTSENPRRLLAGEPLEPVAPVRLERGLFARLRELAFGRR